MQAEVESLAKEIYESLFRPILEYPIKTLDLPVAGGGYSADSVKMIFDLVNYLNEVDDPKPRKGRSKGENQLVDDEDGQSTLSFLKSVRRSTARVFGPHISSLGLHPGVYCYGATGRFQPTAFLAAVAFVQDLEKRNAFNEFTTARRTFEEFVLGYRHFVNQIAGNYGAGTRGLTALLKMYRTVLSMTVNGASSTEIVTSLKTQEDLSFLREITDEDRRYGRNFSKETKSAAYLREALVKELTCRICGARLHFKGISIDHAERREDGGSGNPDNAQLTHPYCNSGYKESIHSRGEMVG